MKRWARVLILLIILAAFWQVTGAVFRSQAWPFDSDEANHALDGLRLAADVRHGQWGAFWRDVYYPHWYPPLYPLTLTPFFLALDPSFWVARLPSAFLTAVVIALTYRAGRVSAGGRAAGLIAAVLMASSPFVWVSGAMCMEEMFAWVGSLMVLNTFAHSQQSGRGTGWVGFWLAVTFLARLSFGLFAAAAVLLAVVLSGGRFAKRLQRAVQMLWPFVVLCVLWWADPAKWVDLADYLQASTPAYDSFFGPQLLRFWEHLITTYTAGPILGGVVLLSVAMAWRRRRDPVQWLALSTVVGTWLGVAVERQTNLRFFLLALPAAFVLAGAGIVEFYAWLGSNFSGRRRQAGLALVVLLLLADLSLSTAVRFKVFPFLMEVAWETDPAAQESYAWLAETTGTDAPLYFVNGWDPFSNAGFAFYLYAAEWPNWQRIRANNVILADLSQTRDAPARLDREIRDLPASYLVYLGNTPVNYAGSWPVYEALLADCFPPGRTAEGGAWLRVWDPAFQDELIAHPWRYVTHASRDAAREQYWYNLFVEMRTGICLN